MRLLIYFEFFIEISFSETAKETARMVISDSQITLLTSDIEFLPNSTTLSQTQNFYIKNYGKICDFSYPDDIIQNCIIKYINYNRNWILIVDSVDDLISILTCKDLRNYPISAIIAKDSIPSLTTFDFTKYNMDVPIYTSPSAIYDRIVSMYTIEKEGDNVIEFYLHPNGDITELMLLRSSGYSLLDENSLHTIKIAYKDYPYPSEKTKIRIRVTYRIY